jgi:hypothetical protein
MDGFQKEILTIYEEITRLDEKKKSLLRSVGDKAQFQNEAQLIEGAVAALIEKAMGLVQNSSEESSERIDTLESSRVEWV